MATGLQVWSKTAASNDVIDAAAQFPEGQAPSSLNDGIRGAMSSAAKWRDDLFGTLVTTGSGTAYALATNQVAGSNGDGYTVQFIPGSTNTGAVTLAVDGNTAKPLRFLTGTDLPAGVLISGSLYQATYRVASTEWLLHSSPLAAPFLVPLGGIIDYMGASAPNSSFALPQGQAISRTTYATLFSLISTTFGSGDGSTTFNIPDLVGRVTAMRDVGSARLSSSYFGGNPATLGAVGGLESHTLAAAQIPSITSTASPSLTVSVNSANWVASSSTDSTAINPPSGGGGSGITASLSGGLVSKIASSGSATGTVSSTSNNTSGSAHNNVQPTMILNKIVRII